MKSSGEHSSADVITSTQQQFSLFNKRINKLAKNPMGMKLIIGLNVYAMPFVWIFSWCTRQWWWWWLVAAADAAAAVAALVAVSMTKILLINIHKLNHTPAFQFDANYFQSKLSLVKFLSKLKRRFGASLPQQCKTFNNPIRRINSAIMIIISFHFNFIINLSLLNQHQYTIFFSYFLYFAHFFRLHFIHGEIDYGGK